MPIQRAQPHQAPTFTALAHAAKQHWGYPAAWITAWREELTFTADGISSHPTFYVEEADTTLGVYRLKLEDLDAELTDLWVHPSAIGRGLGRALFAHAESTAQSLGATRLHLASDPHAETFYLHLGMTRFGERDATIADHPRVLPLLQKPL
jgi:GNAT superfamily N-acetyltransferase